MAVLAYSTFLIYCSLVKVFITPLSLFFFSLSLSVVLSNMTNLSCTFPIPSPQEKWVQWCVLFWSFFYFLPSCLSLICSLNFSLFQGLLEVVWVMLLLCREFEPYLEMSKAARDTRGILNRCNLQVPLPPQ